jgi:hypothetical protein
MVAKVTFQGAVPFQGIGPNKRINVRWVCGSFVSINLSIVGINELGHPTDQYGRLEVVNNVVSVSLDSSAIKLEDDLGVFRCLSGLAAHRNQTGELIRVRGNQPRIAVVGNEGYPRDR